MEADCLLEMLVTFANDRYFNFVFQWAGKEDFCYLSRENKVLMPSSVGGQSEVHTVHLLYVMT